MSFEIKHQSRQTSVVNYYVLKCKAEKNLAPDLKNFSQELESMKDTICRALQKKLGTPSCWIVADKAVLNLPFMIFMPNWTYIYCPINIFDSLVKTDLCLLFDSHIKPNFCLLF